MGEISNNSAFYGRYVTKKKKAVPLSVSCEIEDLYREEATKCRIALGDIERAHRELDNLGVPRKQRNSPFSLSLEGRIRQVKGE